MKRHQTIFLKIKQVLNTHLAERLIEHEGGEYLTIDGSEIWVACSSIDLIIGTGIFHNHYSDNEDNLEDSVQRIEDLLTKSIKVTTFYKGKSVFKQRFEIQGDGMAEEVGTVMTWLFQFWRPTTETVDVNDPILACADIREEMNEIRSVFHS
jgi:hypothetical protein